MDIILKEKAYEKLGLSFNQTCYLLSLRNRITKDEFQELLNERHIFIRDNMIQLNGKGYNAITEVLRLSTIVTTNEDDVKALAQAMAEIFPSGKKIGTNKYWRGNSALVVKKLNGFLKRYGMFPSETILKATDAYVKSFGIDTSLMRILPYFIEKDGESDLLTSIENIEEGDDGSAFAENLL
jgi:hypothetical protein